MIRSLLQSNALVIGLGLVLAATSAVESTAPLIAAFGIALLWVSVHRPSVPVALAFCGILFDARGMTSFQIMGLPVTVSKLMVLYAVGSHTLHVLVLRKQLVDWMPVSGAMLAIICTMLLSLVTAVQPSLGYMDIAGVLMLVMMAHLTYSSVPQRDLPWMLRLMSAVTVFVLLWTLFTQRKQGFFVTLDHAWQQRTSGAYGDPNAWSTALLVVCPMLIAFLVKDKHWSATPMLLALGAAFPACIFQSMSRAGLISFVAISPGLFWMVRKRKGLVVLALIALFVTIPMIINIDAALLRYRTLIDPTLESDLGHGSLAERRALLQAGVRIFLENPVLGVGVGLFRMHASYVSAGEVWKIAHNSYVNVAAEQGLPGLLAHGFLMFTLFKSAWACWNRPVDDAARTFGFGFFLSLLAFSAMAATLNLATFAVAWYMLALGLLVGRYHGAEDVVDPVEQARLAQLAEAAG